jgi:hypothetical protein
VLNVLAKAIAGVRTVIVIHNESCENSGEEVSKASAPFFFAC